MNISKISHINTFKTTPDTNQNHLDKTQTSLSKKTESLKPMQKVPSGLSKVYFAGEINYQPDNKNRYFLDEADFTNGKITGKDVNFMNTTFEKPANFINTTIEAKFTSFARAIFKGIADFEFSYINSDYIGFNESEFKQFANFNLGQMKAKNISFADIKAHETFKFDDMVLSADSITFVNSQFERAKFRNTIFDAENISFRNTRFNEFGVFSKAFFNGHVDFTNAKFNKDYLMFTNAHFEKGANFSNIPTGWLQGILEGATYKKGTKDLFILPNDMLFEDLGLIVKPEKKPTLESLGIKPKDHTPTLEELGIKAKDKPIDYKKLGVKEPNKDPKIEMDDLLDKFSKLPEGEEKEKVKKRLSELF